MRFCKRVQVCGQEYSVVRVTARTPKKQLPAAWAEDTYGYCDYDKARIWVRAVPGNPATELDTFIHELQHAVLNVSGAGRFIKHEEDFLHTYTPALISTLKAARVLR